MENHSMHSQSHYEASETAQVYANYNRNYRAVGVMWGVFTICFAIINIVVFLQPQWIGDTITSPGTGYFGLFEYCELTQSGINMFCVGRFDEFSSILTPAFQASTFFIGFSALLVLICICCMLLFFFLSPTMVFMIQGWIQIASGICMFVGCLVYPFGWDNPQIQRICGNDTAHFNMGQCGIRWAYILAIIGIFDAFILAILSFVLASRYIRKPVQAGLLTKSEMNGYVETESKPSMHIQPVLTVPADAVTDGYSEFSHHSTKRSRKGDFSL